jgi:hypothetical protein
MEKREKQLKWIKLVLASVVALVIVGLGFKEIEKSQIVGNSQYRFNMAMIGESSGITFLSFDPSEKSVLSLTFPSDLAIKSRTSGEYSISSLYKLGSYSGKGGMFARQKVQGFMRVPIPGYVVTTGKKAISKSSFRMTMIKAMFGKMDTSLSRLDAAVLFLRSGGYAWRNVEEKELVRAGVIADNTYHPERMQEYVGSRLFDWNIGSGSITVAVINASGENGLGSDIADFLTNLGLDVVMVRSVNNDSQVERSEWQVGNEEVAEDLGYIFKHLFGFNEAMVENVPEEYRSMVLIRIGKDAKELF